MRGAAGAAERSQVLTLVQELFTRYGVAHDQGSPRALAGLFTEDGQMEVIGAEGPLAGTESGGRDELLRHFAPLQGLARTRRHFFTNVLVEDHVNDDGTLRATAYCLVTERSAAPAVTATAVYDATVRQTPDGLRFASVQLRLDAPA